jgi:hypothetical protein
MATDADQFESDVAESKREQSSISFPYSDLEVGIEVSRAVYNRAAFGVCNLDELAAEMGQVVSGAFRLKTGTAKIFELTDREGKSGIKLTDLGREILAPETERAARVEAFLRVPLYAKVFEKYKGHMLPPPKALEREMQAFGVARKQTDKARQAFERSARQAGFFESGEDRLVRPRVDLPTRKLDDQGEAPAPENPQGTSPNGGASGGGQSTGKGHPLIQGLLLTLPEPGETWDSESRANWLRMAASIFDMIYIGSAGPVQVTAPKETATGQ